MQSKHTPGPWAAGRAAIHNDGWIITSNPPDLSDACVEISSYVRGKANARLIAAAPDLLEALEEIRNWLAYINDDGLEFKRIARIDAAIAAARGEVTA